jgi:hypothetical protein
VEIGITRKRKIKERMMKKLMVLCAVVLGLCFGGPQVVGAEMIGLYSFQQGLGFTGEITYNFTPMNNTQLLPTFCIERNINVVVPGSYDARYVALSGGLVQAAYLIEKYAPLVHGAYSTYSVLETGVALQLAVWKLDGFDPTGDFPTTGALYNLYQTFLNDDGTPTGNWVVAQLYKGNTEYQDILVNVPEPSALLLFGFGLLGLAGVRRKLKK